MKDSTKIFSFSEISLLAVKTGSIFLFLTLFSIMPSYSFATIKKDLPPQDVINQALQQAELSGQIKSIVQQPGGISEFLRIKRCEKYDQAKIKCKGNDQYLTLLKVKNEKTAQNCEKAQITKPVDESTVARLSFLTASKIASEKHRLLFS